MNRYAVALLFESRDGRLYHSLVLITAADEHEAEKFAIQKKKERLAIRGIDPTPLTVRSVVSYLVPR